MVGSLKIRTVEPARAVRAPWALAPFATLPLDGGARELVATPEDVRAAIERVEAPAGGA